MSMAKPLEAVVLVVSDTAHTQGTSTDKSGPVLVDILEREAGVVFDTIRVVVVPDEQEAIRQARCGCRAATELVAPSSLTDRDGK